MTQVHKRAKMKSWLSDCCNVESRMSYILFQPCPTLSLCIDGLELSPCPHFITLFSQNIHLVPSPFHLAPSPFHPTPLSLFLRPYQPHHTIHFHHLTTNFLTLLLSPNQFPYKCKKRSTETNFVSHSTVTSVMLCPQADIYNSRNIGLITSAKDRLGKDEETLSLREKKCTMLRDIFLSLSF